MIELRNSELRIELLDPTADAAKLGPRFCWGGFIWQIYDAVVGPLLSGPEWPEPAPSAFNGQGLPESFRHRTLDGQPLTWCGENGVALGAGDLRIGVDGQVQLITPCRWEIIRQRESVEFNTRHISAGFHHELTRRIELADREVRSFTRLKNLSADAPLVLEWFAHPFFPLVDGLLQAKITPGAILADNPGFTLRSGTLTQKCRFNSSTDGHMERSLSLPPGRVLGATIGHPTVTHAEFETSFVPSTCVIWGNDRTFSFEPYLTLNLAPGEIREWNLRYRFGASSGISTSDFTSRIAPAR